MSASRIPAKRCVDACKRSWLPYLHRCLLQIAAAQVVIKPRPWPRAWRDQACNGQKAQYLGWSVLTMLSKVWVVPPLKLVFKIDSVVAPHWNWRLCCMEHQLIVHCSLPSSPWSLMLDTRARNDLRIGVTASTPSKMVCTVKPGNHQSPYYFFFFT